MNMFLRLHLLTIVPVLLLGPWILLRPKGDRAHKILGKTWALLMIASCLFSFGVQTEGHLTWLHGLSAYTLYSVGKALYAIRKKDLKTHQGAMRGAYIGTCVAFLFAAAMPDRLVGTWIRHFF